MRYEGCDLYKKEYVDIPSPQCKLYLLFQEDAQMYGIDYEGPACNEQDYGIIVPTNNFTLSPSNAQALQSLVNPCQKSDSFGIDIYLQTLEAVHQLFST